MAPVGSLSGRVRHLEERCGMSEDTLERQRAKEERRAIIATRLDRVMERVEQDNPGEPSRRRAALEELRERVERRRRGGLGKRVGALEEFVESQVQERMRLEVEALLDLLQEHLTREEFLKVARVVLEASEDHGT